MGYKNTVGYSTFTLLPERLMEVNVEVGQFTDNMPPHL
jgi:hypothetical protein